MTYWPMQGNAEAAGMNTDLGFSDSGTITKHSLLWIRFQDADDFGRLLFAHCDLLGCLCTLGGAFKYNPISYSPVLLPPSDHASMSIIYFIWFSGYKNWELTFTLMVGMGCSRLWNVPGERLWRYFGLPLLSRNHRSRVFPRRVICDDSLV
jgi:hypothetical protein